MITRIGQAGFNTGFTSIYWTYASGFPKAGNISKMVDKKLGAKRDIVIEEIIIPQNLFEKEKVIRQEKRTKMTIGIGGDSERLGEEKIIDIPATPQAKSLEGSYGGFQPKPAVEIIIVAMKPLSEKTYVDQALKNKKGITWLDDGRIPYKNEKPNIGGRAKHSRGEGYGFKPLKENCIANTQGRFPANLLVSNDVLNDGKIRSAWRPNRIIGQKTKGSWAGRDELHRTYPDSGSYSRYFDLDKWAVSKGVKDTFPFLIVPKASKSEKNRGLDFNPINNTDKYQGKFPQSKADRLNINKHPTVKPKKLAHYLITLGSREGDIMVDMFCGSGTFLVSAKELNRRFLGFDTEMEYVKISKARLSAINAIQDKLF